MTVATDQIRTVKEAREEHVSEITDAEGGQPMLLATGRLTGFAACMGRVGAHPDGGAIVDPQSVELLGLKVGDAFLAVSR
jgi:arginine N-succinyltransferase